MKFWMLSHVGCSLACESMNQSEANLNLWIKPILFPRPGSFLAMLPRVTEARWRTRACWVGAAGPSGATDPGGSAGPSGVAGPASWP
jgi:hypothetical protein